MASTSKINNLRNITFVDKKPVYSKYKNPNNFTQRHAKKDKFYKKVPAKKSRQHKIKNKMSSKKVSNSKLRRKRSKLTKLVNTRPEYFWRKAAPFIFENKKRKREHQKIVRKLQRQAIAEKDKIVKLSNNVLFFSKSDGIYSSYWVGKFIGMLIRAGKKKKAGNSVYRAFAILKYRFRLNPLLALIELLDKLKPSFKLRQYRFRRGRKFLNKEYPSIVIREKRYRLALLWLYNSIIKEDSFFALKFSEKIFYKIADFVSSPRRNSLIKTRKSYMKRIMWGQFNMRFNWRKKTK